MVSKKHVGPITNFESLEKHCVDGDDVCIYRPGEPQWESMAQQCNEFAIFTVPNADMIIADKKGIVIRWPKGPVEYWLWKSIRKAMAG